MIIDLMAASADHVLAATDYLAQFEIEQKAPPGEERYLAFMGIVKWFCILAGIAALLLAGAMFGYEKFFAHGDVQSPKKIAAAVAGGVIASTAAGLMQFAWGM